MCVVPSGLGSAEACIQFASAQQLQEAAQTHLAAGRTDTMQEVNWERCAACCGDPHQTYAVVQS